MKYELKLKDVFYDNTTYNRDNKTAKNYSEYNRTPVPDALELTPVSSPTEIVRRVQEWKEFL